MKKQKLKNNTYLQECHKKFRYWNFAFLLLLFGFTTPILGQDCNAISLSINPNNAQTIDIAGLTSPHYVVKIFDEGWNRILNCSDDCEFVGAYDPGLYRVHVILFDENWQYICETDFLEITIEEGEDPCQTICEQDLIELTSQAAVDAFCGCEVVEGDMRITGNVTNLAPLNGLKQVKGFLAIFETELANFSGLESLEIVEDALYIGINPVLKNLKGLENLENVRRLLVEQNPIIETLEGINASSVTSVSITSNDALIDIQALKNIQSLNSLNIIANKKLPNLEGLNNLANLGNGTTQGGSAVSLVIAFNESLENLDALENLKNLKERLVVELNPSLSNCCGIAHLIDDDPNNGIVNSEIVIENNREGCNSVEEILEHCGGGTVANCDAIIVSINPNNPQTIDIAGLTAPHYIVKVYDENWNRLFDCSTNCSTALGAYHPGLYRVHVILFDENWQYICETDFLEFTIEEGEDPCQTICERDEIRLNSQAEVDAFCGCEVVEGDMIIRGDVTNLAPLNGLKQVKGSLVIFETELTNFSGLESLEIVEDALNIRGNPVLKNLKGLEELEQIKTLFVIDNPTLETLEGINVSSVMSVEISVNAALINIQALRNIQSLISLQIGSNKKLPNLEGLNNLTNIGDGTTSFPQDLGSSSLVILNNESLENLDALKNLKNLDERLLIEGNPSLNSCCGIAHLIDSDPNNGRVKSEVLISNNREGCNSITEILANCTESPPFCDGVVVKEFIDELSGATGIEIKVGLRDREAFRYKVREQNNNLIDQQNFVTENTIKLIVIPGAYTVEIEKYRLPPAFGLAPTLLCQTGPISVFVPVVEIVPPSCDLIALSINPNNNRTIDIAGLTTPHYIVKVYDENWNRVLDCLDDCEFVSAYDPGLYRIHVQLYDANWQYICETNFLEITIEEVDPPSNCDAVALSINPNNAGTIDIAGLNSPHYIVKVYDENWNRILDCSDDCEFVGSYEAGLYRVHVQLYDASWQLICETDFLEIQVPGVSNDSRAVSNDIFDMSTYLKAQTVQLEWVAGKIPSTHQFVVEHSTDGENFAAIATLDIDQINGRFFNYTDDNPSFGSNYYRIQQQFKGTESRLSSIKKVDFYLNEKAISVYPNPVQHTLTIQTKALKGKKGAIQIYNAFGQQIEALPTKVFDQDFEAIQVDNYQNGLYYLSIKADNLPLISKKFLVEKME